MGCTGAKVNEKMWNGMTPDQYADYMWEQPPQVRNKVVEKEKSMIIFSRHLRPDWIFSVQ